jgi:peptidoglycan/LPS O-acetylase OafA/YrhL
VSSVRGGAWEADVPRRPSPFSPTSRPTSARPEASAKSGYRPFLDGLRAVAVLGVLVYHLDRDWLPGGYLGVDIFFVLSGYLITMLLLAEHANSGRINLPAFWSRRIRRLFPALLVMLTVMAVLIDINGDPLAIGQARGDLLSTLFYVANWHFITSGQSYFTQFLAVSPDRHTWSLAIEEQFYLFWPLVTAFVLARFRRSALAVVAASVATASALWMVVIFDGADPSRAYFGTDSRIFEILIGALLAIGLGGPARDRLLRFGRRVAPLALAAIALAYVGLADDNALYYRGGAVLLSLAVAGLIAGLEAGSPIDRLLSLKPLVLVGLASYGMYLWHFPVIIFTNLWLGPTYELANAAVAVAITFAATAVSYVVVETPIRRRGLLIGYKLTPARLARVVPAASAIVAVVIVATTLGGVTDPNWDQDQGGNSVAVYTPPPGSATASLSATATPGPTLGPSASPTPTPSPTPMGGPGLTVGLVGDSVMVSAEPGLQAEAARRGWSLVAAAHRACPVGWGTVYISPGTRSPEDCSGVKAMQDQLLAAKPDVILWHDLQSTFGRHDPNGKYVAPGTAAWKQSLYTDWTNVLNRFLAAGAQVVILLPPLRSQQAAGCAGVASAARCLEIQSQDPVIRAATKEWFDSLDGEKGVYLIEIDSLLCPNGCPCPATISGIQVRLKGYDQTHFSTAGASWIAPQVFDRMLAALNGTGPTPSAGAPATPSAGATAAASGVLAAP